MRPAQVRYYFDADILGVGKLIAGLRPDCTYPGDTGATPHKRERPACIISSPATPDAEWLGPVSQQGWLIITRDRHIQSRPAEIGAVVQHHARMVALSSADAQPA